MSTVQESLTRIRKVVLEWSDFHLTEPLNETLGVGEYIITNHLPEIRRIRWYSMHSALHAEAMWQKYVKDPGLEGEKQQSVFDYYVSGTTYMLAQCHFTEQERSALLGHIAASVQWMHKSPFIPTDVKQYTEESAGLDGFIRNNPWILFIFILSGLKI